MTDTVRALSKVHPHHTQRLVHRQHVFSTCVSMRPQELKDPQLDVPDMVRRHLVMLLSSCVTVSRWRRDCYSTMLQLVQQ